MTKGQILTSIWQYINSIRINMNIETDVYDNSIENFLISLEEQIEKETENE